MIKRKYSINKIIYENNGQKSFFESDNLFFKSINMSKKQRLINLCKVFKLKKIIISKYLPIKLLDIDKI